MTRADLEHIIRAAGTIADVDDIVVVGSQAVLGEFPDAQAEFLVFNEAEVFPQQHPERSDLIDASIGEGSPFQRSFGYYAHGVDETTSILPAGWRDRLILVTGENTRQVRGWCLETTIWRSPSTPPGGRRTWSSPGRWPGTAWPAARRSNSGWRRRRFIPKFEP